MLFGLDACAILRAAYGLAFALCAAPALAAPLTLEQAVRIAEEANPAIRNARAAIHAAEGQLAESRAFLWNNPEASLEYSRTRGLWRTRARTEQLGPGPGVLVHDRVRG